MRMNKNMGRKTAAFKLLALTSTAIVGLSLPSAGMAQEWTGATSGNWLDGANWSPAQVPTATDDVTIDQTPGFIPRLNGVGSDGQAHDIIIGSTVSGGGLLQIYNGATLTSNQTILGNSAGNTGGIDISSNAALPASHWTNAGSLIIGNSGFGVLTVTKGTATTGSALLGANAGSQGLGLISGTEAKWINNGGLTIGGGGTGTLSISNGGTVNNTGAGTIGDAAGSTGTVTVDGLGSTWTNNGDLFVGDTGTGALNIANGGVVSNLTGKIGSGTGSNGTVAVAGSGSIWTSTGGVIAGDFGDGTLNITDGGTANSLFGTLGNRVDSSGTAMVDGTDSSWNNAGILNIGNFGEGTLSISGGGSVHNTDAFIGGTSSGVGSVSVDGAGSDWTNTAGLTIGNFGTGTLTVSNGGAVNNNEGILGFELGATGSVTIDGAGSTWTNGGNLFVGVNGTGALNITNAGAVSSATGILAGEPGGQGSAAIDGAGSAWILSGELVTGAAGEGALTISNGGTVSNAVGTIGAGAGSNGTATVDGAGSIWTNNGSLTVGDSGDAVLNITNGGTVQDVAGFVASTGSASTGRVIVDGAGSSWINDVGTVIGVNGDGRLDIRNGGLVTGVIGALGSAAGSSGVGTVNGAGSAWNVSGDLYVGFAGDGALTIANGGTVSAGGALVLANAVGSTGDLNIGGATNAGTLNATVVQFGAGDGRINFNHTNTNYAFDTAITGLGTINHLAGVTHLTADSSAFTGATFVSGGALMVDGKLGSLVAVQAGGVLGGMGSIGGAVTIASGGTLQGLQGQTLTMNSLHLNGGANIDATFNMPGGAALFNVLNDLTLNGTLNLTAGGAFGPGVYALMTYGGVLTDNGLDIGTTPSGTTTSDFAVQTSVAGQVNLIDTALPTLTFWDGDAAGSADNSAVNGGSGIWSATSTNWTNISGATNGAMHPQPGFAIFQGLAGTVSVDASAGDVAVIGMQIASDGYQITGAPITLADTNSVIRVGNGSVAGADFTATIGSVLTGTGGLNKTDLGTLILTADNDYAGGTTITNGMLQLGNGGTSGSIVGDVVNNRTLAFNRSDVMTFAGAISGTGVIQQNGAGTTNLTGTSNTFAGMVAINGGGLGITSGGVLNASSVYAGFNVGSTGTLTVDGPSSSLTTTDALIVGAGGAGALTVSNGASVSDDLAIVGLLAGSSGTVTVDGAGSTWASAIDFVIGSAGVGTLNIVNGGSVTSAFGSLSAAVGSQGTVTVSGAGSSWINSGELVIGASGTGALTIENGGKVISAFSGLAANIGAVGTVAVNGAGSTWTNSDDLVVGLRGTGVLTIANGGAADNVDGVLGYDPGATGSVTVDGVGSTWTNSGNVLVGGSGVGMLNIVNGGAVSGAIGYVGFDAGSSGAATVDGAGSTWANAGNLVIGTEGSGTLTIANGGTVSTGGTFVLAGNAGSTGVLNIGAAAGSFAAGTGTFDVGDFEFGTGAGTVNFNHTNASYIFAADMTGTGTINQFAGNTNLTGSSNGFIGAVNVTGGRLSVNGSLAGGQVTVGNGGTLGGNGIIGSLTAQSGSIIAPGNSIGTLNVAGNASFGAGSIYQVELNAAGQSDLLNVAGTVNIANGALLSIVKTDAAPYILGTHYNILTAAGGVSGGYTFNNIQLTNFIGLVGGSDTHNIYLDVAKTKTFASAGVTANEIATGGALDARPLTNGLVSAVANLPTDVSAQGAFNQLSGEIHASAKGVTIEESRFVREAALDRLRGTIDATSTTSEDRVSIWGRGFGSRGRMNGDGNAASIKRDDSGYLMGVDGMVGDNWRVGFVGGYSQSSFHDGARSSSGESDNYHVGVYGGAQWGKIAFRSGLAYTLHELSITRTVAFPGFSDALKGSYNARTAQAFGELGYSMKSGRAAFEPFANIAYVSLSTDDFAEKGGVAALTGKSDNTGVTFTTLGSRVASTFTLDNGRNVTARGTLGWRHAFGDTTPQSTMAFAGGSSFNIGGVPIFSDAAMVDLGLDVNVSEKATLGFSYGGQFGSGSSDHSVRANFVVQF